MVFLYKHVIKQDLGVVDAVRARRPRRIPVVLTRSEVERVLSFLTSTQAIMATMLYGNGLRLVECHRLRVKDIDSEQRQIIVRDGKDDRITVLPEAEIPDLEKHLNRTKALHEVFTERGYGECFRRRTSPSILALGHEVGRLPTSRPNSLLSI